MSRTDGKPPAVAPFPPSNQAFLEAIYGADWKRVHVTGFAGDPHAPPVGAALAWAGGPAGARLAALDAAPQNAYYCVSLFRGGQRQARFLDRWMVLGVDDVGPKIAPADVLRLLGEPTYQIETSPGNEQWGYRLAEPVTDAAWANAAIAAVVRVLVGEAGRDPGMRDVTRYLRLPYGRNQKKSYGPGGFATRGSAWR